jgi:holo-[acyl-carrier-protein] synthase
LSAKLAGVGIGIVSVPRFERALERFGERLLCRLFVGEELDYARRRRRGTESLAVRLAAKWAGRDALRTLGWSGLGPRALALVRLPPGPPSLEGRGPTATRLAAEGLRFSVSLTHDRELAVATVWLERTREHASLSRP